MTVAYSPERQRFEASVEGHPDVAFIDVIKATTVWTFSHTEVPAALEGRGVGSRLVEAALDHVRALGAGVIPSCPFVAAYIRRHPEQADLVPERFRFLIDVEVTDDGFA